MSPVTPRLRLTIAALTLAAVTGGAFLVSSAPAQTKPVQTSSALKRNKKAYTPSAQEIQRYLEIVPGAVEGNALGYAQFLAGLTRVQGPGVIVTLTDSKKPVPGGLLPGMMPPNIIHGTDINQTVNELKAAGAEAIAVNGQRLVATSAVRCRGAEVYVNNIPLAAPYVINAIGDSKALAGMLTMPGGIASQIKNYDPAMFTVQQSPTLTLPAYAGGGGMRYAKPVRAGAQASPILPKRLFSVSLQVPPEGVHAVQVYVTDAAGRHLAAARTYEPSTKVTLPVETVGHSVSFQIYDNGRLTKTQQMTGGLASSDFAYKPTLLAALLDQRDRDQAEQTKVSARLEALNVQLQAMRQKMSQKPYSFAPASPPDTMNQNVLRDSIKLKSLHGKSVLEEQLAAAQSEVQRTTALPPQSRTRMAATQKLKDLIAEQQYVQNNYKYVSRWAGMHKTEAKAEEVVKRQIRQETRQQVELQANIVIADARITTLDS